MVKSHKAAVLVAAIVIGFGQVVLGWPGYDLPQVRLRVAEATQVAPSNNA